MRLFGRKKAPRRVRKGFLWQMDATPREIEILERIAEGMTTKEIAAVFFVSPETVKSHVRRLLEKMEARNRPQLVSLGYQRGWLTIGSPSASSDPSPLSPPTSASEQSDSRDEASRSPTGTSRGSWLRS